MMKSIIMGLLLMGIGTGAAQAQVQQHKVQVSEVKVTPTSGVENQAEITFETTKQSLGTFSSEDCVQKTVFTFTNTGTAPLVIHQAFASCGCTVPTFTKTPIKPGEKGQIDVTYNGKGKFPGRFSKTITIRSNATNEVVRLTLEGEMTEK